MAHSLAGNHIEVGNLFVDCNVEVPLQKKK